MEPPPPRDVPGQGWELDLSDPEPDAGPAMPDACAGAEPDLTVDGGRGASGPRPGPTRSTAVAAALALLLALAGWTWDQDRRSAELDALLGCVAAGQSAVGYAEGRVAGVTEYVRPSLALQMPDRTRAGIYRLIGTAAEQTLPDLRQASEGCREVSALPWHGDLRSARQAYLDHLAARTAALEAVSRDASAVPTDRDRLRALSARARTALLAAAGAGTAADRVRATAGW